MQASAEPFRAAPTVVRNDVKEEAKEEAKVEVKEEMKEELKEEIDFDKATPVLIREALSCIVLRFVASGMVMYLGFFCSVCWHARCEFDAQR